MAKKIMKCNYKESLKLALKNLILLIRIGLPFFLISFGVCYYVFSDVITFSDTIGVAFVVSVWGFFNIIHLFDFEFYSSGWNLDKGCFEYTTRSHTKTSIIGKILFFSVTTLICGYVVYDIYQKSIF